MRLSVKTFLALTSMVFIAMSCDYDVVEEAPMETPVVIQFESSEHIVREDHGEMTFTIAFSKALASEGTIKVLVDSTYADHFRTDPELMHGIITIPVAKDETEKTFVLSPVDNDQADENKEIKLAILEGHHGFQLGPKKNYYLTIENED